MTLTVFNFCQYVRLSCANKLFTRDRDPPYITPFYRKYLAEKAKYKLIRCGQTTKADLLSKKIGKCIDHARNKVLRKASASDTRQLWQLLCSSNWAGKKHSHSTKVTIRPGLTGTVPVWGGLSRCPERLLSGCQNVPVWTWSPGRDKLF